MCADTEGAAADQSGLARRVEAFSEVVITASQGEARASIAMSPTRLALVQRGPPRSVLFQCPCGCGDTISMNVDPAAGRAWRLRVREGRLTLMPSVWRTTGCRSHFILWDNGVWWCRFADDEDEDETWPAEMQAELRAEWRRIRATMRDRPGGAPTGDDPGRR